MANGNNTFEKGTWNPLPTNCTRNFTLTWFRCAEYGLVAVTECISWVLQTEVGPKEWMGTEVIFRLKWKDGQTFVVFKHAKWKRPDVFMHHCSTKWAVFLLSLRDWLERSEGRPAPYDVKISADD